MTSPETLQDLTFVDNKGVTVDMADFAGKPVLIVNTASKCGFTPQYDGLQKLYEEFGPSGLVVLGFPCDQFAHQEPGTTPRSRPSARSTTASPSRCRPRWT